MNFKDLFKNKKEEKIVFDKKMPNEANLEYQYYNFLSWCNKNIQIIKELSSEYSLEDLVKFIDKMAIWYEFKYNDKHIKNIFDNIDDFDGNLIKDEFNNDLLVSLLNKDELYLLKNPRYKNPSFSRDNKTGYMPRIKLSKKGRVMEFKQSKYDYQYEYQELNAPIFYKVALDNDLLDENNLNKLKEVIVNFDNRIKFRNNLFNAIMERIILRGNNIYSVYRAMMFAKDFDLDISIPARYGFGNHKYNICIINEYLKNGGNIDLEGYYDYLYTQSYSDGSYVELVSIKDILNNKYRKFTEEEKALHQRLVNVIDSIIPKEPLEKQEDLVKRLRIERGLNRSRSRQSGTKIITNNMNIVR